MERTSLFLGRVGELTLKGGNRRDFERCLVQNAELFLEGSGAKVRLASGRLYVRCPEESEQAAAFALSHLAGIAGWAKARAVAKDMGAIDRAVLEEAEAAKAAGCRTFKIEAKRGDKAFPLNSFEIAKEAGAAVADAGLMSVDVHAPDVVISVEVREAAFVYGREASAPRGLPCGTGGRALLLLSGGIDSPVAGYRMICRGVKVDSVYFHSHPYTSPEAQKKVEDLAAILATYSLGGHLNVLPFTDVQKRIKERVPEAFVTVVLRVCMVKAAQSLAERIGTQALVTGESLGQVASQTMENMAAVNSFARLPVLRPLVGMDKDEITATSRKIGAFGISILPFEDCCTLFSPKHPVLKAKAEEVSAIMRELDIEPLLEEAIKNRERIRFSRFGERLARLN